MFTKEQVKTLMLQISDPLTTDNLTQKEIENLIDELINKPVETTNEQPTSEQIDNALDCLHGDNSCNHSKVISYLNRLT